MSMISLPSYERPADLSRWLVRVGTMSVVLFALYVIWAQFSGASECRGVAFSAAAFNRWGEIRRCDFVIRRFGSEIGRVPLSD
jgi:hypothetical protein